MGKASVLCFGILIGIFVYVLSGITQTLRESFKYGGVLQTLAVDILSPLSQTALVANLYEVTCWRHMAALVQQQVKSESVQISSEESCAAVLIGISALSLFTGLLFRSFAGGIFAAVGCVVFIPMKYENDCRKRKLEVAHGMPGIYRTLSIALGSGQTLSQAIEYVGNHSHGTVSQYFVRASLKLRCGMPVETVVEELASDLSVPGSSLLATALVISHRTGSPLRNLFLRTAALVKHQAEFERLLSVKTAQVRLSARIVCLLPLLLIGTLSLISPDFQQGLATTSGLLCVAVALGMDACALIIIKRLMKKVL